MEGSLPPVYWGAIMAYIMVEGPEGAGKTEGAAWLVTTLKTAGFDVLPVHEPGDGTLGTLVRSTLSGIKRDHHESLKSYTRDGSEMERLIAHLTTETYNGPDVLDTIRSDYTNIKEMMRRDSAFDKLLSALTVAKGIDIEIVA
ncbi:Thymidylate kinase-like protein, partial [mine drainage metagenome]